MNIENEIRKIKAAQDVQRKVLSAVLAKLDIDGGFNSLNMIEALRSQIGAAVHSNEYSSNSDNLAPLLFVEEAYRSELDALSSLVNALKHQMKAG
jgi:hypothetical protein